MYTIWRVWSYAYSNDTEILSFIKVRTRIRVMIRGRRKREWEIYIWHENSARKGLWFWHKWVHDDEQERCSVKSLCLWTALGTPTKQRQERSHIAKNSMIKWLYFTMWQDRVSYESFVEGLTAKFDQSHLHSLVIGLTGLQQLVFKISLD